MRDIAETLQTLILLMALLLELILMLGIVYSFSLLIKALRNLGTLAEQPKQAARQLEVETPVPAPAPVIQALATTRYKCYRCKARLPENPIDSLIDESGTILVFKCGRCGKPNWVDPIKETVQEPVAPSTS